jgi:Protein of unknown function (DUF2934)
MIISSGKHRGMDKVTEEDVRGLAQPLWESAARPYGMALDFWLMAEQMVLEMMAASARIQDAAFRPPPPPLAGEELPSAVPVWKVRALAECMWESAGRQFGMAQDYWLSAERHVLTMLRAATSLPSDEKMQPWAAELFALEPTAYLERIRLMAYNYWEAAGQRYGQALDYWLRAEREMLNTMATAAEPVAPMKVPEVATDDEPSARSEAMQVASVNHRVLA